MIWKPFPKQEEALLSDAFETLFGGSRGPGKTDAGLVWLTYDTENPYYRALVIRKNADDLVDWVDRAVKFYSNMKARITNRPAVIVFPSGATIRTGHLKDDQAYTKYQGHEYHRMLIEELTQIPDEKRYLQLIASCRTTVKELKPRIFLTTNPGGLGHQWVKKRFVDPAPPNTVFKDEISGRTRIFIPATLDDNPVLNAVDPDYVRQLDALRSVDPELYKAWRLGDWNTFAGQYFKEFRPDLHIINPFIPNKSQFKMFIGGLDWGRANPFAFYLTGLQRKTNEGVEYYRAWTFLELYGTEKSPAQWAEDIKTKLDFYNLTLDDITFVQCDNQIFNKGLDNSKSILDQFADVDERFRTVFKAGSKDRIPGWENLHNWLSLSPDGMPYWLITSDCHNLIRTLPTLVHDELNVEDVDDEGEAHAADATRYQFKAIRWVDAKVGGVGKSRPTSTTLPVAVTREGKQVSIDTEKMAEAFMKKNRRYGNSV